MNIMKHTHIIILTKSGLLLVVLAMLSFGACSGDKEVTKPGTSQISAPTLSPETSTFTFENQFLAFDYGTEWRVSGSTDNSFVLTHKEKPGDVLLSARWTELPATGAGDLVDLYRNQLNLMSEEVQKLASIKIGNIEAERYVSIITRENREQAVAMHILFSSGKTAYLIIFSAGPDDFVTYIASANQVIGTVRADNH
jgi:hypothetical protein